MVLGGDTMLWCCWVALVLGDGREGVGLARSVDKGNCFVFSRARLFLTAGFLSSFPLFAYLMCL